MTDTTLVSIVVAFHRPASLERLLSAVREVSTEVIVVNVEADPAVRAVAKCTVIDVEENCGYAAAVNVAVAASRAAVVAFMNDDVLIEPKDLRLLHQALVRGDADVIIPATQSEGGELERIVMALPTPRTLLVEWCLLPDAPLRVMERYARIEKWGDPSVRRRIPAATAAFVVAPRELLEEYPLPTDYFMYWEEMEWFWQLRKAECRVLYEPGARIGHAGGSGDLRPEKDRLLARNAVRCVRRTQGRRAAALVWPIVVLWWARLWIVDLFRAARGSSRGSARSRLAGLAAAVGAWREI